MAEALTKNVEQVWWKAGNAPWELHCRPFRVAPRIYYVGNTWVGAFLIDTGDGLALIDTAVFECVYDVINNIWELGFDPGNIKNVFLTHCHIDHAGGVNQIKQISNADVWLSKEDDEFLEHPANTNLGVQFKMVPVPVDKHYDYNTPIVLGDVTIRVVPAPGHTPGTVAFFIEVPDEEGKKLVAGIHGGVGPNTMTDEYYEKFHMDSSLRTQFIEGCEDLKKYHVDITLPSHPAHGDLMKRISNDPMDYTPLVDQEEWSKFLQIRKEFAEKLNK